MIFGETVCINVDMFVWLASSRHSCKVVEGSEVVDAIEAVGADNMDGKPTVPVVIVGCGVLA